MTAPSLLIIETNPIHYHAPVYRAIENKWGVQVKSLYGSDFTLSGYFDRDFQTRFSLDIDVPSTPDQCTFLSRVSEGGARCFEEVTAKGMRQALSTLKVQAILVTGYSPLFHLHAFLNACRAAVPILFRAETTNFPARNHWRRSTRNLLLRFLYSKCARLLPIGKRSYSHYLQLGCPAQKLVLSPYCVDTKPFRCDETARQDLRSVTRAALGVSSDSLVLLFSGKLINHKRPLMILEAVRMLPETLRQRITVAYLGNGPELDSILKFSNLAPSVNTVCIGFKGQSELSPYYHAADLFVLPSKSETWGLVVNEALHHGVPCVVTDTVGCALDLVQSGVTGEIAAGSPESLAQTIQRALPLTGNSSVRAQCRSLVSNYTVEHAADGIFRGFQEATASRLAG